MSSDYQTAFMLLAIGMITVFIILVLVVNVGRAIILFTNRYIKLPVSVEPPVVTSAIAAKKLAAISAAVNIATRGRGMIEKVEKI